MGFSQEVRDFIGGYTAIHDIRQKKKAGELDEKRIDSDIEYKDAIIDIQRQELELKKQKHLDAMARAGASAAASAARAADKAEEKTRKAAVGDGPVQVPGYDSMLFEDQSLGYYYPPDPTETPNGSGDPFRYHLADGGVVPSGEELAYWERLNDILPEGALEAAAARRGPSTRGGKRSTAPDIDDETTRWERLDDILPEGALEAAAARRGPSTRGGKRGTAPAIDDEPTFWEQLDDILPEGALEAAAARRGPSTRGGKRGPAPAIDDEPTYWERLSDILPEGALEAAAARRGPSTRGGKRSTAPVDTPVDTPNRDRILAGMSGEKMRFSPLSTQIVYNRAAEAADAVLRGQNAQQGIGRAAVGAGSDIRVDLVTGKGAMTPEEIKAIGDKIDPNGMIPAHLKTMAKLSEIFTHYRNLGDTESAYIISTKLLAGEKQLSQTLGMLAAEAMRNGNAAEAAKLFGDAFDRFPTDHNIELKPAADGVMHYAVRKGGKIVEQGKLTGAEFMQMAGEVANGQMFMKGLMQFAASNKPQRAMSAQGALPVLADAADALTARDAIKEELKTMMEYGTATEEEIASARQKLAAADKVYAARRKAAIAALEGIPFDEVSPTQLGTLHGLAGPGSAAAIDNTGGDGGGGLAPPVADRVVGQVYTSPNGRRGEWTGSGWRLVE